MNNDDYWQSQYERMRKSPFNKTDNGVVFYDELYSSEGVWITLFKTGNVSQNKIRLAKRELRRDRDVVGFSVQEVI